MFDQTVSTLSSSFAALVLSIFHLLIFLKKPLNLKGWNLIFQVQNSDREKMGQVVVKMLKKIVGLSNANLVKNTDGPQAKRTVDKDVV